MILQNSYTFQPKLLKTKQMLHFVTFLWGLGYTYTSIVYNWLSSLFILRFSLLNLSTWKHVFCLKPTPIQQLPDFCGVTVYVKRDDLNHKIIQGNKLRKLKHNIKYALENNYKQLATFGGAFSNHLVATAQAAQLMGLPSLGFIRGDELEGQIDKWSPTLLQAQQFGMELFFLSRQEYRLKQNSLIVQESLSESSYLIPEGGSNKLALLGVAEIIAELTEQINQPSHIISAVGTGGTLAGLIDGVVQNNWHTKVRGIPVLKGAGFLKDDIKNLSQQHTKIDWQLYLDYHAGGYGKSNDATRVFAEKFKRNNAINLDKIYTSKSFYAAYDLIKKGKITAASKVVILHTGGLQGGIV